MPGTEYPQPLFFLTYYYYLCEMEFSNLSFEELIDLRNRVDNMIYSYEDGYLYICKVRSYGRNWTENVKNTFELEQLCDRYNGDDGIVDVYSTNPNLNGIYNYGALMYIESQEDYDNWYGYNQLNRLIPQIKEELDKWDNRNEVPFMYRPTFAPAYTRGDLANYELQLGVYDMSFVPPKPYSDVE
jgi:hypothetical protein